MGITLHNLATLQARGLLERGTNVLDIGSSNLYQADRVREFLAYYGVTPDDEFVHRLERGSAYGPNGGTNESFVGELLEQAKIRYRSFDIASGYKTQIFDLNTDALGAGLAGTFNTVLNFGTTEHVVNQMNAFRVIHDALTIGGHVVHQLPTLGYIDHGYFCYTPRFFFDLCGYNGYEVIDFAYQGPAEGKDIFNIVRDYSTYFPVLNAYADGRPPMKATDIASWIIMRKTGRAPFRLPSEKSTSVYA